jgi:hypothetical protein
VATGIRDIVLFRDFVPENGGEYFGALMLCFTVGIVASALRVFRALLEGRERMARNLVRHCIAVMSGANVTLLARVSTSDTVSRRKSIIYHLSVTVVC